MTDQDRRIGVGIVGAGWLGDVHARAWERLRHHYPDLPVRPAMVAVADSVPAARDVAMRRHGFDRAYADWRELVADPSIDVVSVTAPNALHREVGVAVVSAGKHLWIEKPVGLSAADAEAIRQAAGASGVAATVGFNYRAAPAMTKLRDMVAAGAIGRPTHARVRLLSDYAAHPLGLHTWRYTLASAGHGVLGDLAAHGIDLARFVLGDLAEIVARTAIFIDRRPQARPGAATYGHGLGDAAAPMAAVENEDYVTALMRTRDDVLVSLECSRVATGDQNNYGIEVHGTKGLAAWDFRTAGELLLSSGDGYLDQPTQRVFAGPDAGDYRHFQPGSAITMSYDDTKVVELAGLVRSLLTGTQEGPGLDDAVAAARVVEAMIASSAGAGWVTLA